MAVSVAKDGEDLLPSQPQVTAAARAFYNNEGPGGGKDRNWLLSQCKPPNETFTGARETDEAPLPYTNHHFGIGPSPLASAAETPNATQDEIIAEVHRLECAQMDVLIDTMVGDDLPHLYDRMTATAISLSDPRCRVLDAGSGRGGTAIRVFERGELNPFVDGVTVAEDQQRYAAELVARNPITKAKLAFHVKDMTKLLVQEEEAKEEEAEEGKKKKPARIHFEKETFHFIYANETDMYIRDIKALYRDFCALLKPKGVFALATWCNMAEHGKVNPYSARIDDNYKTVMNTDDEIVQGLEGAGFSRIRVRDLSQEARPYWDVRSRWEHASGVEPHFVEGLAKGYVRYLVIAAQK